jgi:hypothetical protein
MKRVNLINVEQNELRRQGRLVDDGHAALFVVPVDGSH